MLANGTVLVPLDGSPLAERAIPYARAMAVRLDCQLVLMTAAYVSEIPGHGPWSDAMLTDPKATCLEYLCGVRQRSALENARLVAKAGYPHEAILEAAHEERASLVVISTHGRSGVSRWMYGSTAGHLLHSSQTPLLVIGKNVTEEPHAPFAPKKVLVPLEGSVLSELALPYAMEIARAFASRITLARAAPLSVEAFPMMVPQVYWPDLDQELIADAKSYLKRIRASLGAPVDVAVLQGPRADTLLSYVEKNAIDLVVMATHGRAGMQRALLGSTADRMLGGPAPVLLIRPE